MAPNPAWTGATALTAKEDSPRGVVTDGARVLFTTGRTQVGENAVREVDLQGGAASQIVAVTPGGVIPNGHLALDGTTIYVAAGRGIVRLSAGAADVVTVVRDRPADVDEVVIAGADLWWTTYQFGDPDRVEVARMPKAGGPAEVVAVNVASGLGRPYPEGGAAVLGSSKGVLRVQAGRPPEAVAGGEALGGAVTRMAVDDDRLYVIVAGSKHRLLAVPRRGGPAVVLTDDVDTESDVVVVGDQVVFFAARGGSSGHSELRAVAKDGGPARTIASGPYADGDLAPVGTNRVVFSADDQVWVAGVR